MPGPDTGGCKTGKRRRRPQTECAKEILLSCSFHPGPSAANAGEGKLRSVAKSKWLFRGGALGLDSLAVSRHPAPGARPIAALGDALLVNVRDLLAVAGKQ